MDDAMNTIELPLFPLNTVLFPGQLLPLHIFEDRYRLMIRRCLAEDKPFGIVLLRGGAEVGENPGVETHSIGTTARIVESSHLADGTLNVVAVGTERFRVIQLYHDEPYLRGEVASWPLVFGENDVRLLALAEAVRSRTVRYIELIATAAGLKIQVGDVPSEPRQVGYLAAVAMQIDNREKQRLLAAETPVEILAIEIALLSRENALLSWMAESKEWPGSVQLGPSGTLLPN